MKHELNLAAIAAAARGDIKNAVIASTPGGIERQEAEGQKAFVTSGTLPNCSQLQQKQLEKAGFTFGTQADDLFVNVRFPPGWTKKATDHSMWSELRDAKGRKRAGIFYKAAFYDRSAHMQLERRYTVSGEALKADGSVFDWAKDKQPVKERAVVTDHATGQTLWASDPWLYAEFSAGDKPTGVATAWLKEHFPEHEDPSAYWD